MESEDVICTFETIPEDWGCEEETCKGEMYNALYKALSKMSERTKYVLTHMYGIGCDKMQVKEIAQSLGISEEAVRKHKVKGMDFIREMFPNMMEAV